MKHTDKLILKLTELRSRNCDAEFAYKEAAQIIKGHDITAFFQKFSEKRHYFCYEMKNEIIRLGGKVDNGTSILDDIERFWMRLKAVISTNNEQAILSECRKIELENWEIYSRTLSSGQIPAKTRSMLERHKVNLDEALYQIMQLKENYIY